MRSTPAEPLAPERRRWQRSAQPAAAPVVGGVSICLLLPSMLSVFGAWPSLAHLDWL